MDAAHQLALQDQKFERSTEDITVVTGPNGVSASKHGAQHPSGPAELWAASIEIAAWIDGDIDAGAPLISESCRLEQLVDDDGLATLRGRLAGDSILTVRVRRSNGYLSPEEADARRQLEERGFSFADPRRFLLVEILPTRSVPALESFLAARTTPKTFLSADLGELTEDRSTGWYSTRREWMGRDAEMSIVSSTDARMATMCGTIATLLSAPSEWQSAATGFAAEALLALYNESWAESEEALLTGDEFAARLRLISIHVAHDDGSFSLEFDDADMFGGHGVHLDGTLTGEFSNAGI